METEPQKPHEKTPAPTRAVRLNWWWGIYLFEAIGFPLLWMIGKGALSDPLALLSLSFLVPMLPMGLGYDFSVLCENIFYRLGLDSVGDWEGLFVLIGLPLGYVIFIVHYQLTSEVKTRRAFLLLMLSLVLLTCGGLVGLGHSLTQAIHY